MTKTLEPTKAPRKPARRPGRAGDVPAARLAADNAQRSKRQGRAAGQPIVVGGMPRVDLLPTEVLVDRRERAVVRRAWLAVIVVGAAAVLASTLAFTSALQAEQELDDAHAETNSLLVQQQGYREVRTTEAQTDLLRAAQAVGGSTEIDWSSYLQNLQDSLPTGVTISGVQIDSASPLETFAQSDGPLDAQRVATLTIAADSATLPTVPVWLDAVEGIPGFVDANANAVTLDSQSGVYTVDMTIHIDEKAFDGKYDLKGDR